MASLHRTRPSFVKSYDSLGHSLALIEALDWNSFDLRIQNLEWDFLENRITRGEAVNRLEKLKEELQEEAPLLDRFKYELKQLEAKVFNYKPTSSLYGIDISGCGFLSAPGYTWLRSIVGSVFNPRRDSSVDKEVEEKEASQSGLRETLRTLGVSVTKGFAQLGNLESAIQLLLKRVSNLELVTASQEETIKSLFGQLTGVNAKLSSLEGVVQFLVKRVCNLEKAVAAQEETIKGLIGVPKAFRNAMKHMTVIGGNVFNIIGNNCTVSVNGTTANGDEPFGSGRYGTGV